MEESYAVFPTVQSLLMDRDNNFTVGYQCCRTIVAKIDAKMIV